MQREGDDTDSFDVVCLGGCSQSLDANVAEQQLAEQRDSARLKNTVSVSLMIAGGAVTVAGLVWVIANRPKRAAAPAVDVMPTQGGATAHASWQF